jgi:GT2 family glycosyltransferase
LLRELGGWDERYWFYAEDIDLCLRVSQAGYRVRFTPHARAVHQKSVTSGMRASWSELSPVEAAIRFRAKSESIKSHRTFFETHYAATTSRPVRFCVRLHFSLQKTKLRLTTRAILAHRQTDGQQSATSAYPAG